MNDRHRYTDAEIAAVYRVIEERRDMRHFAGGQVPDDVLQRLLAAAHAAPSVGFMQPWRFLRVTDRELRQSIFELVQEERQHTANALQDRGDEFLALKVEGVLDCAELLAVALRGGRERDIFGRRTLPEMDLASAACAIQNLWLAARAEGYGMGWVSLFDPARLKALLGMPADSHPVALLCLGPVQEFYDRPMLARENWAQREPLENLLMENRWTDHE